MSKPFWGYNDEAMARKFWGDTIDKYPRTEKVIDVVDDPTKWPQTSSKQKILYRVETPTDIISW